MDVGSIAIHQCVCIRPSVDIQPGRIVEYNKEDTRSHLYCIHVKGNVNFRLRPKKTGNSKSKLDIWTNKAFQHQQLDYCLSIVALLKLDLCTKQGFSALAA
jgi:hypothetical protein